MVELKELQHLVALCKHRHFTRAAASIGISQPALTKSVRRLEAALDAKLVDRIRTGVVPTPIGEEVVRRAAAVVSGVVELEREVDLMRGICTGELTVGIGPAMAESQITEVIAKLVEGRPGLRLRIRVDHWRQLSEWLLDGQLDLFVADTTEAKRDQRLRCRPLPAEHFVWFCRSRHPLAGRKRITRRDMLRYPIATPRMPEWAREWFAEAAPADSDRCVTSHPSVGTIECENYALLKRLVLSSDCISAALSSTVAVEIAQGEIAALRVKAPALKTEAGIVTLRDRTLSPLTDALIVEILALAGSRRRTS